MFYTASFQQVEQLYPDILITEPEKMRIYFTHEDGTRRFVDRCNGYCFSDKPWGLETEYLTEGIDQEFVDDVDYLSMNIRNSIKAPDGWTFVSCDYAAEELRLGALNTKSKVFMDAFKHNKDPHLNTAVMMFGEEAVKKNKKKYRSLAKGCNSVDAYYATENGYEKLKDTDHILDLNGNKQKFGYVVEDRDMYRLYLSNGQIFDVTTNHKYKDMGMLYPEYKEIYEGMQIGLRKLKDNKFNTNCKYVYSYKTNAGSTAVTKVYNINLTRDLGYLIGLYLGDGYLPESEPNGYVRSMTICCHHSNADYVQRIMENNLGKSKAIRGVKRQESDNYVLLTFSNAALLRFILENFGRTKTKNIPDICYTFPLEFNLGLVDGLLDSDGKVGTDCADLGVSSEVLARSFANLLALLGLPAKWRETTYTYKNEIKPFYYVTLLDMRYTNLKVDYKAARLNGKLNRYLGYHLYDVVNSKFNGKYYDKLNLISKGLLNTLTCRAIEKFIPTLEHNDYYPVTIQKIENIKGKANIMECETHYYSAEGYNQHNCNFGLQYGGSWRVVQAEDMSEEEAQSIYDSYMLAQADHFAVQKAQVDQTHQTLTEYTFFGLPVRLHNYYKSTSPGMQSAGERLAKNHRIQGTGADVLSIAYMKLWKNIFGKIPNIEDFVRFQITVHDEIDFIVRNDVLNIIVPELIKNMQTQMPDWEIPLTVGLSFGPTFGTQYEFKYDPKTFKVLGPDMSPIEKKEEKVEETKEPEKEQEAIKIEF